MTTGAPTGLLIRFALPMLVGNIFQQLYNLVDSVIVGRFVGAEALAAVGSTASITFFFFALCNGIGNGGGIVTSQRFGTGDKSGVKSCITNVAYLMTGVSVVVGILAFFLSRPLLNLLGTPSEIISDALNYLRLQCVGVIFIALYNYSANMLRALGDSRTPLYFLIFSCILNAILDLLFVCVIHMGVFGAALATVIAQFLAGSLCLFFAFRTNEYFDLSREDFAPSKEIIGRASALGIPISMQFALIALSTMALQRVVNGFGAVAVAAFTATSRIEQLIHQPYQTLGASLATFCGQNYGAKKTGRVISGFHRGVVIMFIFSALMLPIMQFFGDSIVRIFVEDAAVIAMGSEALRITSWFYAFLGIIYVTRGVLNGIGDAFFALLNGIVEILCRLLIPLPMTSIPALGVWGIWWSVGVTWAISAITALMRYVFVRKKRDLHEKSAEP
ncbi:MAG: MATE family efflux transporter [Lachnospiraceae bacterium]|nr:MATE family efflux transporter [Lachnospiraceae bacterium]